MIKGGMESSVPPKIMERWSGDKKNFRLGLLCHYLFGDGSTQFISLDVEDEGAAIVNPSLSFSTETNAHICASCSGLLLVSCFKGNLPEYHVFDLSAQQCLPFSQPQITRRITTSGLAFDGHHFQVVLVFNSEEEQARVAESSVAGAARGGGLLEIEIFSSKTGKWKQQRPMVRLPPELAKLNTSPLFSNGAIHWELGGYLLIHRVNDGHCKLIQLPNSSQKWSWHSMTFGQCLWESEGRVHYCYTDVEGIHIWVLLKEQDHDSYSYYHNYVDREKFQWKLAYTIRHQTLVSQNPEIFIRLDQNNNCFSEWKPYFISPCAYNEGSQTMYLRLPGILVSFNMRTQILKEVCAFKFPNINFYCCTFFPIVYSQQGNPPVGDVRSTAEEGNMVCLPIANILAKASEAKNCNTSV